MYIVPEVKKYTSCDKFVISGCKFIFPENIDERVVKASKKVAAGDTEVNVTVNNEGGDGYVLELSAEKINLIAKSQAAAFYGIQTILQIIKN